MKSNIESQHRWIVPEGSKLIQCTKQENSSGVLEFKFTFSKDEELFEKIFNRIVKKITIVNPSIVVTFDNEETLEFPLL